MRIFVLLSFAVFAIAQSSAAQCSDATNCYGPGLGADSLANTVIGGQYNNALSFRFRAGRTAPLQKIHLYHLVDNGGYAAGTGGKLQITVNTDDGTAAHNPSSVVLASFLLSNPLTASPSKNFPIITFAAPPALVSGQLYHIVFTNADASPSTNFMSVNALYQKTPGTPAQPTVSDLDSAVLLRQLGGAWTPRKGFTPILQLDYQDGRIEGTGYMEVWSGAAQTISGATAVRERFTVTGPKKAAKVAALRVMRVSGSDPLTVRLENADGSLIEQGNIPAASIPLSYAWVKHTFASARTLLPGQTYNLVFQAPSSSAYRVFPVRKGMAYNFRVPSYFADGYAQFKQGTTWTGWTQWGATNRTDGDLQFYLGLTEAGADAPVISNVAAGSISAGSATISWVTDQAADGQVEYGATTAYGGSNSLNPTMAASHAQVLSGLVAGTVYHYRVRSRNSAGVLSVSGNLTFTTASAALLSPVISSVAAGSITSTSATVSWMTNQSADGQVEYGLTTSYGSSTTLNPTMALSHAQIPSGLAAGTLYHYRVRSKNSAGVLSVSGDFTFTTAAAGVSAPASSTSTSSTYYGAGLGADSLANTVVGGSGGNIVSYRFRAKHTGNLQRIHLYLIPDRAGYSGGTGGRIRITVQTDDGTAAHNPASTVLATYLLTNPKADNPSRYFPIFTFATPPQLNDGQLYHLVFTNVDPNPSVNYLSVDALYLRAPPTPAQPTVSDTDSAELLRRPNTSWAPRKGYTPILQLDFSDGWTEGIGYMEAWVGAQRTISGSNAVRERFTVKGSDRNVRRVAIRVMRASGSNPLIVRLETGTGTLIEQGSIAASAVSTAHGWVNYTFSTTRTLQAGQTYNLVVSTASTSSYRMFPIRKGSAYNFAPATYYNDGYAQWSQNGSWVGWTQWGATNRTDGDLQFYFGM